MKPRLPSHYRLRFEPPGPLGDESLIFTSARKRVVIKGHSFREFLNEVVPLLDGRHTLEEIQSQVSGTFDARDLQTCFDMLSQHQLIEDAEHVAFDAHLVAKIEPQLNYFREVSQTPLELQEKLRNATIAVLGLGALGAVAATALAAANVGHVRCIDNLAVTGTDPFLAQLFALQDVGQLRAKVVKERIMVVNPSTKVQVITEPLTTDAHVVAAIEEADFVLGCLAPGLASLTYKLNRACLQTKTPWSSGEVSAFEGIVGPSVFPHETACYLCYKMRAVACAEDPQDALAALKDQDRRKLDDSPHRENLPFGAGIIGHMLALEGFKYLIGMKPTTAGKIMSIDFGQCTLQKHMILRKPWCPACFVSPPATAPNPSETA